MSGPGGFGQQVPGQMVRGQMPNQMQQQRPQFAGGPQQQQMLRPPGQSGGWQGQQGQQQGQVRSPAPPPGGQFMQQQQSPYSSHSGSGTGLAPGGVGSPGGGFVGGGAGGGPSPGSGGSQPQPGSVGVSPVPSPAGGGVARSNTPGGGGGPNSGQPVQPQPAQPPPPVNLSVVCRIGQETVQEIQSRTHGVFCYLKQLQVPVGSQGKDNDVLKSKQQLTEVLNGLTMLFKRLHHCYTKVQEHTGDINGESVGMEYTSNIENLIPLKGREDVRMELEKKRGDTYRKELEENEELKRQLTAKNRHLKKIIDDNRVLIWEINTMLAMR